MFVFAPRAAPQPMSSSPETENLMTLSYLLVRNESGV